MLYPCTIIADENSESWNYASKVFHHLKSKSGKYKLVGAEVIQFRDGEIKPHIKENIRRTNCFFIHDSGKDPSRWYVELALFNYIMKDAGAKEVTSVIPYLCFARQDRKDMSRVPISARVLADSIQNYADRVVTLDVHNPAIQGFYDINFENLHSFPHVCDYLKKKHPEIMKDAVIMSPDAGGAQRVQNFARILGNDDVVFGYKSRHKPGEVKELKILGSVKGKNVIIVDDMIDSGGTLVKSAQEARAEGAKKVFAYATHGLFTKGIDGIVNHFDKVFLSDTLSVKRHDKIEIISSVELFAEAIHRINEGISLSALFEKPTHD